MLDNFSRNIINRRPRIRFISPRSVDTIPNPSPAKAEDGKAARVQNIIDNFKNLNTAAQVIEEIISERAKGEILVLDLDDPEDFATAQAAARIFPDCREEVEGLPGVRVCKTITFEKYRKALETLKAHGKQVGQQNQIPGVIPDARANFGKLDEDRRPQVNNMSRIMPPVSIPAYLLVTIPLLFLMLHPLRSLYVNSKIAGHTHVPPVGGPGVPVNPT